MKITYEIVHGKCVYHTTMDTTQNQLWSRRNLFCSLQDKILNLQARRHD